MTYHAHISADDSVTPAAEVERIDPRTIVIRDTAEDTNDGAQEALNAIADDAVVDAAVEPEAVESDPTCPIEPDGRGERGEAAATPLPLSSTLEPVAAAVPPQLVESSDVYLPAPGTNPVLAALQQAGLYREAIGGGRHSVACPWAAEHDGNASGEATFVEPDRAHPVGTFTCPHVHAERADASRLLVHLGLSDAVARCKPIIRIAPGELDRIVDAAEWLLARDISLFQAGGAIVQIVRSPDTGDLSTSPVNDQALMRRLSATVDWEKNDGRGSEWKRCDPPSNVVTMMLKSTDHPHLRPLTGLARQPFFRSDGSLVTSPGYDSASRVFAAFQPADFPLMPATKEAALAAVGELMSLLREFHFGSPSDTAAALCAILTAAVRGSLRLAPAFNISASSSGSGKSYLAELIALFAAPGYPHSMSYPSTPDEATKAMLAVLMGRPAVVLWDDMPKDWIAYGAINSTLTSPSISGRVLGMSKMASVGTNSLFLGTGNNIVPLDDLRRRVLSIYLSPPSETPATIRREGRPVDVVRQDRGRFVALALTVAGAFIAAGSPEQGLTPIGSFDEWSRRCREPLVWLGMPDPAASLIEQVSHDDRVQEFGAVLEALAQAFGSQTVMTRQIVERSLHSAQLRDALYELPILERGSINPHLLGQQLKKNRNRVIDGRRLEDAPCSQRKGWRIVSVDAG